jgi:hypothetical protein
MTTPKTLVARVLGGREGSPGPAQYRQPSTNVYKTKAPEWTLKGRHPTSERANDQTQHHIVISVQQLVKDQRYHQHRDTRLVMVIISQARIMFHLDLVPMHRNLHWHRDMPMLGIQGETILDLELITLNQSLQMRRTNTHCINEQLVADPILARQVQPHIHPITSHRNERHRRRPCTSGQRTRHLTKRLATSISDPHWEDRIGRSNTGRTLS